MASVAVCPGSFDPITYGHLDVIRKALAVFDEVHVVVVHNPEKQPVLSVDVRQKLVRQVLDLEGLSPRTYVGSLTSGLLVDYCISVGSNVIVKGLRSSADVVYETPMAVVNHNLAKIETVFLLPDPAHTIVSSSLVRTVARLGGDVTPYAPRVVADALHAKFQGE